MTALDADSLNQTSPTHATAGLDGAATPPLATGDELPTPQAREEPGSAPAQPPPPSSTAPKAKASLPCVTTIKNSFNVSHSEIINSFQNTGGSGKQKSGDAIHPGDDGGMGKGTSDDNSEDSHPGADHNPTPSSAPFHNTGTTSSQSAAPFPWYHPNVGSVPLMQEFLLLTGQSDFQTSASESPQAFPPPFVPYTHYGVNPGAQGTASAPVIHNFNSGNVRTINYNGDAMDAGASRRAQGITKRNGKKGVRDSKPNEEPPSSSTYLSVLSLGLSMVLAYLVWG